MRQMNALSLVALAVLGALLSACSDGAISPAPGPTPTPTPTPPSKTLVWEAPKYFEDNTPVVPSRDLQRFEIYIKQDPFFGPDDNPVATASPLDNKYNLANVSPPLLNGVTYYVSMRVVTIKGVKSDFSPAVSFSLP